MDLGRDIGNFAAKLGVTLLNGLIDIFSGNFSSLVGGKAPTRCWKHSNKRTGWMIDRRASRGAPRPSSSAFTTPASPPSARRTAWSSASWPSTTSGRRPMRPSSPSATRWNELSPAVGDVEGYRLRQQNQRRCPPTWPGATDLQTLTYVPPGGDTRTPVWNYVSARGRGLAERTRNMPNGWAGAWPRIRGRPRAARCRSCTRVEADVASVPQRMAEKLGTFRPLNVNGSPLYEEMDRPNNSNAYAARNFARDHRGAWRTISVSGCLGMPSTATWSNDFQAAWKFRTDGYRKALFAKMALGPWAQALAEAPGQRAAVRRVVVRCSAARLAVIQPDRALERPEPHRHRGRRPGLGLARVQRQCRCAVPLSSTPTAPADLQALIPDEADSDA